MGLFKCEAGTVESSESKSGTSAMLDHESAVSQRYAAGAQQAQAQLCCAVQYDKALLAHIPDEIIERDYGCGDPSRFVREGDTVLDLGSGGGKLCYIAAKLAGPNGR